MKLFTGILELEPERSIQQTLKIHNKSLLLMLVSDEEKTEPSSFAKRRLCSVCDLRNADLTFVRLAEETVTAAVINFDLDFSGQCGLV